MILTYAAVFWVITTITVAAVYGYLIVFNEEKLNRDMSMVIGLSLVFSPLTLIAILATMWYCGMERKWKIKANIMYRNWEGAARLKAFRTANGSFDWNRDPKRFEYMRETVRDLSDKDLEFLCTVKKDILEIEKDVRDCLVDEMLERKIIKA